MTPERLRLAALQPRGQPRSSSSLMMILAHLGLSGADLEQLDRR
jgi:hypothetical protein